MMILIYLPGPTGILFRRMYYKKRFKKCGKNLIVDVGTIISNIQNVSVGDNVHIDKNCLLETGVPVSKKIKYIQNSKTTLVNEIFIGNNIHISQNCSLIGYGGIKIEDEVVLSSGTKIYSMTNIVNDPKSKTEIIKLMPYKEAFFLSGPVFIGKNSWVGLNSILMPGVLIGSNSFVRSNSLVLGQFVDNSYLAGDPAEFKRKRFDDS